jgi:hypothetical protein
VAHTHRERERERERDGSLAQQSQSRLFAELCAGGVFGP